MVTETREHTSAIVRDIQNYIGGRWIAYDGDTEPVYNPATGEIVGRAPLSTAREVDAAVAAAQAIFPAWSNLAVGARTDILFRFRHLIEEHSDELADLVT